MRPSEPGPSARVYAHEDSPDYSIRGYLKQQEWYRNMESKICCILISKSKRHLRKLGLSLLLAIYLAYLAAVILLGSGIPEEDYWCRGDGFFFILSGFIGAGLLYFKVLKPYFRKNISRRLKKSHLCQKFYGGVEEISHKWQFKLTLSTIVIGGIFAFLVYDAYNELSRLTPLIGLLVFLVLGVLFSVAPAKIVWRHVIWGIGLQFCLGLMTLRWPAGKYGLECFVSKVSALLENANKGSEFMFGDFATKYQIFSFQIGGMIMFFIMGTHILLFYGIIQWIVIKIGWLLQITIGTTACESVNASANIFLSMIECPMLLIPYLKDMTKSELHAVLTGGFATIAGGILAVYISFGVDALHLLTASVMSAPAALAYSKLVYPEIEVSKTVVSNIRIEKRKEKNALHAAMEGLIGAITMFANTTACLLGFIAFISLVDAILNWACLLLDFEDGICSSSALFGFMFMPLALTMGVAWEDCFHVGQLIGTKTMINEFVAYVQLSDFIKKGLLLKRSEIIATYALCGFANFGSIGIVLGALGAWVPERKADLASIGFSAMMAGNVACFLTACVAGSLIPLEASQEITRNITGDLSPPSIGYDL